MTLNNGQRVTFAATANGRQPSAQTATTATFNSLAAGSYTITVTATSTSTATSTATQTGDPYVKSGPLSVCRSDTKGWQDIGINSCSGQANVSYVRAANFTMANNAAGAAGAVPLLDAYGTTTPGNYNSGSHYEYPSTSSSAPPGTWFPTPGDTGGPALGGVYVWTTQSAAPRDATHLCEALVTHQFMGATTSYYQIFTYGTQPSACTLEFWS